MTGPVIELRMVSEDPGPGLEPFGWQGADIYLEPQPVVSNADIQRLSAEARPGRLMLQIELKDDGARRLETITGSNIGRRIAMLIDGRVVSAPVIRDRIGRRIGTRIPLDGSGPLAQDEAERLTRALNEAWSR